MDGFERMHLEGMRGNIKQNERYCSKYDSLAFFGDPFIEPGERRDVKAIYKMVMEGKSDLEIAEADFNGYNRFMRAIQKLRTFIRPKREGYPEVLLILGPPGCGKTKECFKQYPDLWEPPIQTGKTDTLWFDGYYGQKEVLLDEFEGHLPLNSLLKLVDKYIRQVPIKGGFTWFNPEVIMFTANDHPSKWYDYSTRVLKEVALRRRIGTVMEYKDGEWIFINNQLEEGEQATDEMRKFWPISWDDSFPKKEKVVSPMKADFFDPVLLLEADEKVNEDQVIYVL